MPNTNFPEDPEERAVHVHIASTIPHDVRCRSQTSGAQTKVHGSPEPGQGGLALATQLPGPALIGCLCSRETR